MRKRNQAQGLKGHSSAVFRFPTFRKKNDCEGKAPVQKMEPSLSSVWQRVQATCSSRSQGHRRSSASVSESNVSASSHSTRRSTFDVSNSLRISKSSAVETFRIPTFRKADGDGEAPVHKKEPSPSIWQRVQATRSSRSHTPRRSSASCSESSVSSSHSTRGSTFDVSNSLENSNSSSLHGTPLSPTCTIFPSSAAAGTVGSPTHASSHLTLPLPHGTVCPSDNYGVLFTFKEVTRGHAEEKTNNIRSGEECSLRNDARDRDNDAERETTADISGRSEQHIDIDVAKESSLSAPPRSSKKPPSLQIGDEEMEGDAASFMQLVPSDMVKTNGDDAEQTHEADKSEVEGRTTQGGAGMSIELPDEMSPDEENGYTLVLAKLRAVDPTTSPSERERPVDTSARFPKPFFCRPLPSKSLETNNAADQTL